MKTTPDIAAAQRFVAETLEPEPEDLSDGKLWKPQVIDAGDGHKSVVFEPAPPRLELRRRWGGRGRNRRD